MKLNPKFTALLKKLTTPSTVKLSHTTELPLVSEPQLKMLLESLYEDDHPTGRLFATLINSIMTHQMRTFMFSKRIMDSLVGSDINANAKICKSNNYKDFMHKCLGDSFLVTLRKHTSNKAGIYRLEDPSFLEILYKIHGEEYFKAQEEAALSFYDNFDEDDNNRLANLSTDDIKRIGRENKKKAIND